MARVASQRYLNFNLDNLVKLTIKNYKRFASPGALLTPSFEHAEYDRKQIRNQTASFCNIIF